MGRTAYDSKGVAYDDWARRLVAEYDHAFDSIGLDPERYGMEVVLTDGGRFADVNCRGHGLWPRKFKGLRRQDGGSCVTAGEDRFFRTLKLMERRDAGMIGCGLDMLPSWAFHGDRTLAAILQTYAMDAADIPGLLHPDEETMDSDFTIEVPGEDEVTLVMHRQPTHVMLTEIRLPGAVLRCDIARSGSAEITVHQDLPNTVCASAIGGTLSELAGHRAFSRMTDVTIKEYRKDVRSTTFRFERRMMALSPIPEGISPCNGMLALTMQADMP